MAIVYARAQCEVGDPRMAIDKLAPFASEYPNEPLLFFALSYRAFLCGEDPEIEERAQEWLPKALCLNPEWFKQLLGVEQYEHLRSMCVAGLNDDDDTDVNDRGLNGGDSR